MIAEVALLLPLDQVFTYQIPKDWQDSCVVGNAVLVPFGKRIATGIITHLEEELQQESVDYEIKPIYDLLDEVPFFSQELLDLTKWIASYYICSWGEVLKACIPNGIEQYSKRKYYSTELPIEAWKGSEKGRKILAYLKYNPGATRKEIIKDLALRNPYQMLQKLAVTKFITSELEITEARTKIKTEKHLQFVLPEQENPFDAIQTIQSRVRGSKQKAILSAMMYFLALGEWQPSQTEVLAKAQAHASSLRRLIQDNVLNVIEKEVIRTPYGIVNQSFQKVKQHELHEAQKIALANIQHAILEEEFRTFLIHGVTGSGKTEVYIAALKEALSKGKTGIVLVPEISLTPQTVQRFQSHFGDKVAVLHSRMTDGERYDMWRLLRRGTKTIVIGPRSAIFAPLANLGVIIVDEEHEASYKQFDPAPRYHARDVAVMRASSNQAVCILGSATPSIESYINTEWNKYQLLEMSKRVPVKGHEAAPLPPVRIIDLTLEKRKHQLDGVLSKELKQAIQERLSKSEQIILLQNRRGYAPVLTCENCGWSPFCKACAVTLTYHKAHRNLQCHYCGTVQRIPSACPKCTHRSFTKIGVGTQRVEEELQQTFPNTKILRMDIDTTAKKNAHENILTQFGNQEASILIGTQMIAKGLDFSNVTLVGVINADTGLLFPDFRAAERTFQLLTQVAGRAGRGDLRGEVILQTRNPSHTAIEHAVTHDYLGFIETELPYRKSLGYPPFVKLVAIAFRGPHEEKTGKMAQRWTDRLASTKLPIEILGPQPAFIARIRRQYYFHTLLKVPRNVPLHQLQATLQKMKKTFKVPAKFHIAIDVDPMDFF